LSKFCIHVSLELNKTIATNLFDLIIRYIFMVVNVYNTFYLLNRINFNTHTWNINDTYLRLV